MSHTPGPWKAIGLDVRRETTPDLGSYMVVAEVTGALSNPSSRADARLIAAAPELLEALRWMLADREHHAETASALIMARAVIRKATGEQP